MQAMGALYIMELSEQVEEHIGVVRNMFRGIHVSNDPLFRAAALWLAAPT